MRTVAIYNFKELEPTAKLRAIEEVREELMEKEYHEAALWAADDCALLEPAHDEMTELLGNDYYEKNGDQFVFKNNRINIEFDDYEIHVQQALEITNSKMFKKISKIDKIKKTKNVSSIIGIEILSACCA